MNIVLSIGQQIQAEETDGVSTHVETLAKTARKLDRVSEKALEVNQMFERSAAKETVSLHEIITDIVSRLGEDCPDATIDTLIDIDSVQTDTQILKGVLEEVVANALEHAGESPAVQIEVQSREQSTAIIVTDDGPGIPRSETQPLRDGEETALKHTSSFGLWFSKWGMQKIGGSIGIAVTETGTQVTLQVPNRSERTEETRSKTATNGALL